MRRSVLGLVVVLLAATTNGTAGEAATTRAPFTLALPIPQVLTASDITLTAQQSDVAVLPGRRTRMWTFNGTFPGPVIRRPSGQPTRVRVVNRLPRSAGSITVHNHGAHAPSSEDGQPHGYLIEPGAARTYRYPMVEDGAPERAATQWYHDHSMDVTGRNVWMGLAGMFIVDDAVDAALPLPRGKYDIPLMVVDRQFDDGNQIPYAFHAAGVRGDRILVNGASQPRLDVATHKYRFRVLNASNERPYEFALSDATPMVQVGNESGLLPEPIVRSSIRLEPAQRADIVVDFGRHRVGARVVLRNLAVVAPYASPDVMQFRVTRRTADRTAIPRELRPAPEFDLASSVSATRTWILDQDPLTGTWTINGRPFDPHRVEAAPVLGSTERWVFVNRSAVSHVMHIHDVDWRVVRRTMPSGHELDEETSLKESVNVRPNEVVVLISRFTDHTGPFMLHCHILEHEDRAMMARFDVVAPPPASPASATDERTRRQYLPGGAGPHGAHLQAPGPASQRAGGTRQRLLRDLVPARPVLHRPGRLQRPTAGVATTGERQDSTVAGVRPDRPDGRGSGRDDRAAAGAALPRAAEFGRRHAADVWPNRQLPHRRDGPTHPPGVWLMDWWCSP